MFHSNNLFFKPFGQHAVKAEDRAMMRAQTGGGKMEYDPNAIPTTSLSAS
jgi:hypothetical protein